MNAVVDESWRKNLRGDWDEFLTNPRPNDWWTGKRPQNCPGRSPSGQLTSLPQPHLTHCTRQQVQDYFDNSWTLTEVLFSSLQTEEAFFRPPYHHLRHPMAFYYCHPSALYINKLRVAGLIDAPINPYFEQLFETGVDEMRWDDMSKNEMTWPTLAEAHHYRKQVYETVCAVIQNHPDLGPHHPPITQDHPLWALFMGFEHERIHLETSSVLIRELPLELVSRPEAWPRPHDSAFRTTNGHFPPQVGDDHPELQFLRVDPKTVTFGKPRDFPSYGWDNEYGRRTVSLQRFSVSHQLVSNGAFYEFVCAGGYREARFWTAAGWEWRTFRNVKWPTFWVPTGPAGLHQYELRTLFEQISMPWDWPVEVNGHEAKAFCNWLSEQHQKSYRLLTEAEHQALRTFSEDPILQFDGQQMWHEQGRNANLAWGTSTPVQGGKANEIGVHDVMGNVWQWLEDDFHPLEGHQVHPYYDDFSSPCYDGEHQMMIGGSWASTGDEASIYARFHFRPHFFQHAGFRVVEADHEGKAVSLHGSENGQQGYETEQMVNDYLTLHFATSETQMPFAFGPTHATDFPKRCADWVREVGLQADIRWERALDVGCAVGRSTFELSRHFQSVIGCDLSRAFIDTAEYLKTQGELTFICKEEGELGQRLTAQVDPQIDRRRVQFRQADACSLPPEWTDFDAVMMANLLCRLPSPKSLLGRLGGPRGLVKLGGVAVFFSPYSWLESFTPKGAWLGGFYDQNQRPIHSAAALTIQMQKQGFILQREIDMPLVIREHRRKYQFIVAHATAWQRVQ